VYRNVYCRDAPTEFRSVHICKCNVNMIRIDLGGDLQLSLVRSELYVSESDCVLSFLLH